ncbi:TfpX/TfpZ family type IV pilin accessory protein [Lysobacter yangpyeongensis]|uniref:TfpX/TfpZ family type IV pilin accessory protein n=1 Tax=Lysobacter yangpyeongensis TaxID=346182 RepID=A0ABW0SPD4_9GAMM
MNRWKASAIHLTLSVLVLTVIATVLVWCWYPPGLFQMANADKLLLIIAGVDVTMGPLMTLIIYKRGKKGLKFDLTVIALLQVVAMGYGLSTVWQSRPVYMVALVDRFRMVFANELEPADLAKGPRQYRSLPWLNVETIAAVLPRDQKKREDLLFLTLDTGKDLHLMPEYYAPFSAGASELLSHSVPAASFARHLHGTDAAQFASAMQDTARVPGRLRVVPISSNRGEATMLVDSRTAAPLKPLAIDPWPVLLELRKSDGKAKSQEQPQ